MSNLGVLLRIALTSLFSHKTKSLIVGSIMFFGTLLVVLGTGLLDAVELSMQKSITSSLAGHLQIHSSDAKDDLALFGGMAGPNADIGELDHFDEVKRVVEGVPNVKVAVPMGLGTAVANADSEIEIVLAKLRKAVREGQAEDVGPLKEQVRQILTAYSKELSNKEALVAATAELAEERSILDKATGEPFWADFDAHPVDSLEFLDTKAAPLLGDGRMMYFRFVGTDVPLFARSFDRFKIVRGEMVPAGQRGMLISQRMYDRMVKHPTARQFDEIHEAVTLTGRVIAQDTSLQERIERMSRQYGRILFQLRPDDARKLEAELGAMFPDKKGDLAKLLEAFLKVDDATLASRYRYFYDVMAPMLRLYAVDIGQDLTLRGFTRSGYMKSVNIKIYGTFAFDGLEGSDLAGGMNVVDMLTFRELYGQMTASQRAELKDLSASVARTDVGREEAEDAMFGGDDASEGLVGEMGAGDAGARAVLDKLQSGKLELANGGSSALPFIQEELDHGLALNVAVILDDPDRLDETRAAIVKAGQDAGLTLKVLDWQEASGLVGQFVVVVRLVLWVAILIIFTVALVIINNSMVMATMERTGEIGTMRALGAPRSFVVAMFLIETMVLGLGSGALGALAGAGVLAWLGSVGIPAGNEVVVFLFGGPHLYPAVGLSNMLSAVGIIVSVSLAATAYPSVLASNIQPVEAMRTQ